MKTVQVCEDAFAAELVKGRLLNEGIDAEVIHAGIEQVIPYSFAMPDLKPRVVVRDEDYERAVALLHESSGGDDPPLECPYCGSREIAFGLYDGNRKRYWARIGAVLLALLTASPLGKIQSSYYCRRCKRRFEGTNAPYANETE